MSHVKNGYGVTRSQIAAALNTAATTMKLSNTYDISRVRVIYYEGSSTFGGGAAHVDNGECAAICSLAVGAPVRVQWMRWDEHGWDNYGPATMWDVKGGIDANGKLVAWDATSTSMASYAKTPSEIRLVRRCPRQASAPGHDVFGDAVRHPEPADHRQDGADLEQLLQGEHAAGAECSADLLRQRAGDRSPRVPGGSGSVPVPAEQHQHGASWHRRGRYHGNPASGSGATRSTASRRQRTGSRRSQTR